jgi:hypothetical protein
MASCCFRLAIWLYKCLSSPGRHSKATNNPDKDTNMTNQLTTLTCGESTISSPDKALVLQFANFVLGANQVKAPAANAGIPAIGYYWEGQGGVNAGVMRGVDGQSDYYLIVATEDLGKFEWGSYGTEVKGAGSASDGAANTRALIEDEDHPAATACAEYEADGHADFYLPARRELQLAEANVSELFAKEWHWSSTQRSADLAFYMDFVDGYQDFYDKGSELRVRPVRRLPI